MLVWTITGSYIKVPHNDGTNHILSDFIVIVTACIEHSIHDIAQSTSPGSYQLEPGDKVTVDCSCFQTLFVVWVFTGVLKIIASTFLHIGVFKQNKYREHMQSLCYFM